MGSAKDGRTDFHQLVDRLVQEGRVFEDPEFPAGPSAIRARTSYDSGDIQWKRPKEICDDPKFFVQGATRFDLDQGDLQDCWFIAAASCLATSHQQLFDWCVPPDQDFDDRYAGVFHFRFWQFGSWVEVVVDDRLPCHEVYEAGSRRFQLIYARNELEKNEFWVPLFEKAYAKLNGSYENLNGGFSSDALVDFTGGLSEFIDITQMRRSPGNLFETLSAMTHMSSLLGSHINSNNPRKLATGLWSGHAYGINNVLQLNGTKHRLLRIRNPWGKDEWTGAWSDSSPEWNTVPENVKREMEMQKRVDGEFWMSFEDWLSHFDRLTICHLTPDAISAEISQADGKQRWNPESYHSAWVKGINAGGSSEYRITDAFWTNQQFPLDFDESKAGADVVISLMQKVAGNNVQLDIGMAVYRVNAGVAERPFGENYNYGELESVQVERCKPLREVTCHCALKPGNYVVIPFTKFPNQSGDFLLRIFTEILH